MPPSRIRRTLLRLASLAVVSLFGSSPVLAENWDMPTAYPPGNYHTENVVAFADEVRKRTAGALDITVHPGASLYRATEIKRAIQGGQVQAGEFLISGHANEDPIFGIDSVPFLATGFPAARRLWDAARPQIAARLARQNLELLYAVPWPPQGLFATRPINSGADLRGRKMRTYNPFTARIAELAGAQPVAIQAAELAHALATGAVDVNITSGATGYDAKVWEVASIFYDARAWVPLNVVAVNARALADLDTELQAAVRAAAEAAEKRGWAKAEARADFYLEALREHGMTVAAPSPELASDLEAIGTRLTREWLEQAGAEGAAILAAFGR